jgi:hypothetical protein
MTSPTAQRSDFSLDVLGRFVCNGLDEALRSTDTTLRPDARPFDVVVVGAGSFGPVVAQHLFAIDRAHRHRVLLLEAGPLAVAEHVQNYPMLGLGVPSATSIADLRAAGQATAAREQVWGLAWHSSTRLPGLAYCLGGRSLFFGGWSPQLLNEEMPTAAGVPSPWPAAVVNDLNGHYFAESAHQIGTEETNDFIFGVLQNALRQVLYDGINTSKITDAIPRPTCPTTPWSAPTQGRAPPGCASSSATPQGPAGCRLRSCRTCSSWRPPWRCKGRPCPASSLSTSSAASRC